MVLLITAPVVAVVELEPLVVTLLLYWLVRVAKVITRISAVLMTITAVAVAVVHTDYLWVV